MSAGGDDEVKIPVQVEEPSPIVHVEIPDGATPVVPENESTR